MTIWYTVMLFVLFVPLCHAQRNPEYITYKSPVKSEQAQGVAIREYRWGPNKGRVEKVFPDGRTVMWSPGEADKAKDDQYMNGDTVLAHEDISVSDWSAQNIANYNAESLRIIANATAENLSGTSEGHKPAERLRDREDMYAKPNWDGFKPENTVLLDHSGSNCIDTVTNAVVSECLQKKGNRK